MAKLSPKQQLFVEAYARGKSGSDAALAAGYSAKRPDVASSHLLKKPAVAEAIAAIRKQNSERTGIDVAWITEKLVQVVHRGFQIDDLPAVNGALKMLGQNAGMFVEKAVDVTDNRIQIQVIQFGSGHPNPAQLAAA